MTYLADTVAQSGQRYVAVPIIDELETLAQRTPSPTLHGGLVYARAVLALGDQAERLYNVALRRRRGPSWRGQGAAPSLAGQRACCWLISLAKGPIPVRCAGSEIGQKGQKGNRSAEVAPLKVPLAAGQAPGGLRPRLETAMALLALPADPCAPATRTARTPQRGGRAYAIYPGGAKNSRAMLSGSLNDKPDP